MFVLQFETVNEDDDGESVDVDIANMFGVSSHGRVHKPTAWVENARIEREKKTGLKRSRCDISSKLFFDTELGADKSNIIIIDIL
jgi:hypothetical protein